MKYYNDICNLDPEEVYKDHCKNFSRFEDQFLSLYEIFNNKKSNIFFYYLLKPFFKNIYVPGTKLNTLFDKLFNKLCDIYIRSIPCIEIKKLKDDFFIFLTKLFGHTFDSEELNAIKTKIPTISKDDIASVRPGYGILPKHYHEIIGKIVNKDISKHTAVNFDDISN